MHVASWKNHGDIVQVLLDNGNKTKTSSPFTDVLILFLNLLGADKRIRNQDHKTPLELTHDPTVRSLLDDKGNALFDRFYLQYLRFCLFLKLFFPIINHEKCKQMVMMTMTIPIE